MRNKTLRKISVLLLSLTMVMTSMNLSFAETIVEESQQNQIQQEEQTEATQNVEPTKDGEGAPSTDSGTSKEEGVQEGNSEKTAGETADATEGQTKPKKGILGVSSPKPSAKTGLVYNGESQYLINDGTPKSGYELAYFIGSDQPLMPIEYGTVELSTKRKAAGTYTVYWISRKWNFFKVKYDTDDSGSFTVTIAPKTVEINWGNTNFVYNGEDQGLAPTVENVVGSDKVSLQCSGKGKNAQDDPYVATVTGLQGNDKDNYQLPTECSTQFRITPATIDSTSLALNKTEFKWTGDTITPPWGNVTASGGKLTSLVSGEDYDLSGNASEVDIGDYTYSVTGKGNYTGTVQRKWSIVGKTPTTVTITGKTGLTYNKESQQLIESESISRTGTINYVLKKGDDVLKRSTNKDEIKATDAGEYTIEYSVDENDDYAGASGSLTVNIAQAEISSVTLKSNAFTYNAHEQTAEITAVKTNNRLTLTELDYSFSGNTGTDADNYTVTVTPAEGNTNLKGSATAKWTIAKANPTFNVVGVSNLKYTGEAQSLIDTTQTSSTAGTTIKYWVEKDTRGFARTDEDTAKRNADIKDTTDPKVTGAGTYYVYYQVNGNNNYSDIGMKDGTASLRHVKVVVSKADIDIIPATGLVYNRESQALCSNPGAGTVRYWGGSSYTSSIPEGTDAGTYTISYYIEGGDNYKDVGSFMSAATKTVTIASKALVENDITVSNVVFANEEVSPTIVVKDGTATLVQDQDYTVEGETSGRDVKDYTITIKGKGNYSGEFTKTWKIIEFSATLSESRTLWTNEEKSTTVSVKKTDGTDLELGKDYTVASATDGCTIFGNVAKATSDGTYTINVTGTGDYEAVGTIPLTWSIVKPTPLTDADFTASDKTWTGSDVTTDVTSPTGLKLDEDYEILSGSTGKDVGEYTVKIKGKGFYSGEIEKTWKVTGTSISSYYVLINDSADYSTTYTGTNITPTVKVYKTRSGSWGNYTYSDEVTDKVAISGDKTGKDVKTYTITVSGDKTKGYSDSKNVTWKITKAIATASLDKTSLEYNATEQMVNPIVKVGDTTLTQGVDYTVSGTFSATHANDDSIIDQNTVYITLQNDNLEFDNILSKKTDTLFWKITPKNLTLSWKEEHVTYDKKEHAPELVMDGLCDADKERVTIGSVVWDINPTALPVNAGTHLMSVTLKFNDSLTGPKFENDYNIKGKNNTAIQGYNKLTNTFFDYFYIDKRPISVLWKDGEDVETTGFEYTFNDTKQMPYAYANPEDICEGDDVPAFNVSVTKASPNASETGPSYNGEVGSYEATASVDSDVWDKFTGKDNYKIADDAQYNQPFKVNQAVFKLAKDNENKYAITFGKNPDFDGEPHTAEVLSLTTVDGIPFDYSKYKENFEFNSTASDAATQTDAGRYNYQLDVKSGNRNFAGSADGEWAIQTDDFSTWTNISATDVIYSAENQAPVVTVKKQLDSDELIQGTDYDVYFIKPDADLTNVFSKNEEGLGYTINQKTILKNDGTAVVDAKESGTYKLLVWGKGNDGSGNYVGGKIIDWKIVPATISKFDFTIDGQSTKSVGYNTLKHKVVVTKVYALTNKDEDGKDVYIKVPTADYEVTGDTEETNVNPDNYTVTVSAKSDSSNFEGTTSDTWEITPEMLNEGDLSLILNDQNPLLKDLIKYYIYDGRVKSVSTIVKHYINGHEMTLNMADPEKPEQLAEYEIITEESTMSESGAGTYKVVVKGVNNYTGTAEATWVIRGIRTDWLIARLTETHYTYDGTEHVPDVKVGLLETLGLPGLVEHEDYEYTIKNSKGEVIRDKDGKFSEEVKSINADTYTVSIKGLKYFQDTKELTYVIEPAEIQKDWILTGDANETLLTNLRKLNGKNYDEPGKYESETGPKGIVRLGITGLTDVQQDIYVKPDSKIITLPEGIKYLEEGVDYEISEDSTTSAKEPKSYRVTINGLGNYEGSSVNVYWSIGTGALVWIKDDLGIPHLLRDYDYSREYDGKEFDIRERIVLTKYSDNPLSLLKDTVFNDGVVIPKENYDITGDFNKKDAGKYNFEITGNGTGGFYQAFEGSWEITPRIVLGRWEQTTVEYNGEVQRPVLKFYHIKSTSQLIDDLKIKSLEDIIKALIDGGKDTLIDKNGILEDYDATARAISLTKPKNVGTYQMFSIPTGDFDKNNYKFYDERILLVENIGIWYTPFEITKKTIGIDWSNLEFTYDGDYHIAKATATGLCGDDVCLLGVTGRQKDAGTWTAKVEGIVWDSKLLGDNYKLPEEGLEHDFVIKERAISEGKFRTVSTTYNGKEQAPEIIGYDTTGFFNNKLLVEGTDYRVKEIKPITETILVNATDAGKYEVVLEGIGNYTGTTTVEWTINKATPTCTVTPIPGLVYNATAQALVKGELNGTAADSDCSIEYCVKDSVIGVLTGLDDWKADAKGTDAGTYLVYYKINGDRNHNNVGPSLLMVRTSTISKASLTADMITLDPAEFGYDGDPHKPTVSVIFNDGTEVPRKDYHIYSWSDTTATDAGKYNIYITTDIVASGNFKDEGLVITKKWEIVPDEVTLSFDGEPYESTYGSAAPEVKATPSEYNKKRPAVKYLYEGTSKGGNYYVGATAPTDAGTYTVTAYIDDKNFSAAEVTTDYIVNQKEIEITWDKTPLVYNGWNQVPDCSIPEGQIVNGDKVTVSATVRGWHAAAGDYTATAKLSGRGSSNYLITNSTEKYTIGKRPVEITWGKDNFVYNGRQQAPRIANVKGLLPLEAILGLVRTDTKVNKRNHTDVGNYSITAILKGYTSGNYEIVEGAEKSFKITKRPVTITINNKEKIYGEHDPRLTWEDRNHRIVRGDRLGIKLVREPGRNIGEYNIFNVNRLNKNYNVRFVNDEGEKAFAVLKINKRPIVFNWTLDKKNINKVTYDAKSHRAEATVGEMGFAYNDAELIDVLYENELKTEVGKYTAKAFLKMKDDEEAKFDLVNNYEVSNDTFNYEIEPVKSVPTGDDSNIYLFLMLGLAAAIAGAAAVARRRKEN